MKQFKVTPKQKVNLGLLKDYFEALPKQRIDMGKGIVVPQQNPYTATCCAGTHMAICLDVRQNERRKRYEYDVWEDNPGLLREKTGIKLKKLEKITGRTYPWDAQKWAKSPRKVFKELYEKAVIVT